jgi:hypothetical protein
MTPPTFPLDKFLTYVYLKMLCKFVVCNSNEITHHTQKCSIMNNNIDAPWSTFIFILLFLPAAIIGYPTFDIGVDVLRLLKDYRR